MCSPITFAEEGVVCACCGEESGSFVRVADNSEVCRRCLERHYEMCDICGRYYTRDEIESDGYDRICKGCAAI